MAGGSDGTVVKVVHDCRMDAEALRLDGKTQLRGVFDTQVAHALVFMNSTRKGLDSILKRWAHDMHSPHARALKEMMRERMRCDPTMWAARPLDADMEAYATNDVAGLLAAHTSLHRKLLDRRLDHRVRELSNDAASGRMNAKDLQL